MFQDSSSGIQGSGHRPEIALTMYLIKFSCINRHFFHSKSRPKWFQVSNAGSILGGVQGESALRALGQAETDLNSASMVPQAMTREEESPVSAQPAGNRCYVKGLNKPPPPGRQAGKLLLPSVKSLGSFGSSSGQPMFVASVWRHQTICQNPASRCTTI